MQTYTYTEEQTNPLFMINAFKISLKVAQDNFKSGDKHVAIEGFSQSDDHKHELIRKYIYPFAFRLLARCKEGRCTYFVHKQKQGVENIFPF